MLINWNTAWWPIHLGFCWAFLLNSHLPVTLLAALPLALFSRKDRLQVGVVELCVGPTFCFGCIDGELATLNVLWQKKKHKINTKLLMLDVCTPVGILLFNEVCSGTLLVHCYLEQKFFLFLSLFKGWIFQIVGCSNMDGLTLHFSPVCRFPDLET